MATIATLTTVAEVKRHLDIPPDDLSYDARIADAVEAATTDILRQTGFILGEAPEDVIDRFQHLQLGWGVYLSKRPVGEVLMIRGRYRGDLEWTTIEDWDLIDYRDGYIVLPSYGGGWPPQVYPPPPPFQKWRDFKWDIVEIHYTVTPWTPPNDVRFAATTFAVYLFQQVPYGPVLSRTEGPVSEKISDKAAPVLLHRTLAPYRREMARAAV